MKISIRDPICIKGPSRTGEFRGGRFFCRISSREVFFVKKTEKNVDFSEKEIIIQKSI